MYLFIDTLEALGLVVFAKFDHTEACGSVSMDEMLCDISREITGESQVVFVLLEELLVA